MNDFHPRFIDKIKNLEETKFSYRKTSISTAEGEFLWSQIRDNQYGSTIEVGCALGMASVYICDAISSHEGRSHLIVDPNQTTKYQGIGIGNLQGLGFDFFTLIEERSEFVLPRLLAENAHFDFAFIDGWHTYDHTLVDFFFLNRMLRVGGMIVFDDADWPAISRLMGYIIRYPCYELVSPTAPPRSVEGWRSFQSRLALFRRLSRLIPLKLRRTVFADALIQPAVGTDILLFSKQRWAAVKKIDEDNRRYSWFEGV